MILWPMKAQISYMILFYLFAYEPPLFTCKYGVHISYYGLENLSCINSILFTSFFFFFRNSRSFFLSFFLSLWLCWVFVSARGFSPAAASGDHSSSRCAGPPPSRPLLSRSTGSRRAGSATVAHGPSRSAARGILPDQGSNPCPPHRQADSQPLRHQGSPIYIFIYLSSSPAHSLLCSYNVLSADPGMCYTHCYVSGLLFMPFLSFLSVTYSSPSKGTSQL